jgi:hypothetical protein
MIRIFRSTSGDSLRAEPEGVPLLQTPDVATLRARLGDSVGLVLNRSEKSALAHAVDTLDPQSSADVVLFCEGRMFRVVARSLDPQASSAPNAALPAAWFAADRESPVLMADLASSVLFACDALRFLGYNASALVVGAGETDSIGDSLRAQQPLALVLGAKLFATAGRRIVEAARSGEPTALVAIIARRPDELLAPPAELDGVLEAPLRLETVAPVLDPLIAQRVRARAARCARGAGS